MATNPLDAALESKEKLAAQQKADDHTLWHAWKQDPTPENLRPLMQRHEPIFRQKVRLWKAPNVNEAAFKADLKIHAVKAYNTYDPSMGASLRTHLENNLKKSMRFNTQMQNYAAIPEHKASHIGRITRAQDELTEDFGRPPTPAEIAEHLNPSLSPRQQLTPQRVEQIQRSQIGDVMGSSFESDPVPRAAIRGREVISLLRPALNTEQQAVFDHLYGLNGKERITSTTRLAQVLGKSPPQISRLRSAILAKYKQYE